MIYLYFIISTILTPLYGALALWRLLKGKEETSKILQRFGLNLSHLHGKENLIWVHCASVGETLSIMPLLDKLSKENPAQEFLITTYTKTAAQIILKRDAAYIHHAYMPYDHPLFVNLFIKKTNPSAVFWVESEFWPISLHHIKKHNIPALALNFRMSEKSYISWKNKASTFIQALLSTFTYAQAQTQEYAYYFESLANSDVKRIGNLKDAAPALIYNPDEFENLSQKWCQRKIVLWASTHEGEEDIACAMYKNLKELHNDLLFIIVPRHPERGKYIASIAEKHGLSCALRSAHNETSKDIEIYIADTLGELGLFYALSPIAIIGNSFVSDPGGGHNMLEAAHLNCAILYGPSYYNFQSMHDAMISEDCVITVKDRHHLIERLEKLLNDTKLIKEYQDKAFTFASKSTDILDQVTQDIISMPFWRKDGRD